MLGKTSISDLSEHVFDLILELYNIDSHLLLSVLPQLEFKLKVNTSYAFYIFEACVLWLLMIFFFMVHQIIWHIKLIHVKHIFALFKGKLRKALKKSNSTSDVLTYSACMPMFGFWLVVFWGLYLSSNNSIFCWLENLTWFVPWFTVVFIVKGFNILKVPCAANCTEKLHLFGIVNFGREK